LGGSGTLTETGTLLGTAAYLSPEQAQGQPATAASDVYSFGVILYRLLAGRLPFEAASPIELARMHVHEQPAPPGEGRPHPPAAAQPAAPATPAAPDDGAPTTHDVAHNRHDSDHDAPATTPTTASVISIVVPLHNEERSVALLYAELQSALEPLGQEWETVFV